jgi:hypothetical protein
VIKMRDLCAGQYVLIGNRWARVNYTALVTGGMKIAMCGLNQDKMLSLGGDALFDLPPLPLDHDVTIRA